MVQNSSEPPGLLVRLQGYASRRLTDLRARITIVDTGARVVERDRDAAGTLLGSALALRMFLFLVPLVLLTLGAQPARGVPSAAHAGAWGFARSARAEAQPPLRCLDSTVRAALGRGASLTEPEAVLRANTDAVPRLTTAPSTLLAPRWRRRDERWIGLC